MCRSYRSTGRSSEDGSAMQSPCRRSTLTVICRIVERSTDFWFLPQSQADASDDAALLTAAKKEFAKIKPHVFGTEKGLKNTAGRHLASSLLSVPANKNNLAKTRVSDAGTGLSVFKTAVCILSDLALIPQLNASTLSGQQSQDHLRR